MHSSPIDPSPEAAFPASKILSLVLISRTHVHIGSQGNEEFWVILFNFYFFIFYCYILLISFQIPMLLCFILSPEIHYHSVCWAQAETLEALGTLWMLWTLPPIVKQSQRGTAWLMGYFIEMKGLVRNPVNYSIWRGLGYITLLTYKILKQKCYRCVAMNSPINPFLFSIEGKHPHLCFFYEDKSFPSFLKQFIYSTQDTECI